jgi:hypothetical protein
MHQVAGGHDRGVPWDKTTGLILVFSLQGFGSGSNGQKREGEEELLYFHQRKDDLSVTSQYLRPPKGQAQQARAMSTGGMRVFEKMVDFPCLFDIKVIGEPDASFDRDILFMIGEVRGGAGQGGQRKPCG